MNIYAIVLGMFTLGFAGVRLVLRPDMTKYFGAGLYASFALIVLTGFFVTSFLPFCLVAGLIFMVTVRNRLDALCRLAALSALLPSISHHLISSGTYVFDLNTLDALMLATLATCMFRASDLPRYQPGVEALLVLAIVVIFSLGVERNFASFSPLREVSRGLLSYALPFYIFSRFTANREEWQHIILAFAVAAMILSVIAVYETFYGWSIFERFRNNLSTGEFMSRNMRVRGGLLRAPTAFWESTSFAVFQMIGVLAVIASRRAFRSHPLWLGSLGLTILGLLATQSRGAVIGLVVGVLALFFVRRQFGRVMMVVALAAVGAGGVFLAARVSPQVAAFAGGGARNGTDEVEYREVLLRRGLQEGAKHPWIGNSRVRLEERMVDVTQGEGIIDFVNTYLYIFLISGLAGLGTALILLTGVYRKLWRRTGADAREPAFLSLQEFVFAALTAELFALLFTSFYERNPHWLMILLAGASVLALRSRAVAARPAPLVVSRTALEPDAPPTRGNGLADGSI